MGCNMGPQMEVLQEINARRDCQDAARAAGNNAEVRQLEEEIVALQVTLDGVMSDDPAVCAEALQCLPSSPGAAARERNPETSDLELLQHVDTPGGGKSCRRHRRVPPPRGGNRGALGQAGRNYGVCDRRCHADRTFLTALFHLKRPADPPSDLSVRRATRSLHPSPGRCPATPSLATRQVQCLGEKDEGLQIRLDEIQHVFPPRLPVRSPHPDIRRCSSRQHSFEDRD